MGLLHSCMCNICEDAEEQQCGTGVREKSAAASCSVRRLGIAEFGCFWRQLASVIAGTARGFHILHYSTYVLLVVVHTEPAMPCRI